MGRVAEGDIHKLETLFVHECLQFCAEQMHCWGNIFEKEMILYFIISYKVVMLLDLLHNPLIVQDYLNLITNTISDLPQAACNNANSMFRCP